MTTKTRTFMCQHTIKMDGIYRYPGEDIELSDQAEIDRLLKLGAIATEEDYVESHEARSKALERRKETTDTDG